MLQWHLQPSCKLDGGVSIYYNVLTTWLIWLQSPLTAILKRFPFVSVEIHIHYISVGDMGPERTKFCHLCQQDLKLCSWTTHRKACEKKAEKQRQNQIVAESIQRQNSGAAAGTHSFLSWSVNYVNWLTCPGSSNLRHARDEHIVNAAGKRHKSHWILYVLPLLHHNRRVWSLEWDRQWHGAHWYICDCHIVTYLHSQTTLNRFSWCRCPWACGTHFPGWWHHVRIPSKQ